MKKVKNKWKKNTINKEDVSVQAQVHNAAGATKMDQPHHQSYTHDDISKG